MNNWMTSNNNHNNQVIKDNHNPDFTKSFLVDYFFEEVQNVQVRVFDEDKKGSARLTDHDFMGLADFQLGDVMCSAGQTYEFNQSSNQRAKNACRRLSFHIPFLSDRSIDWIAHRVFLIMEGMATNKPSSLL